MNSATAQSDRSPGDVLEPCKLIEISAGIPEVLFETVVRSTPFELNLLTLPPV